MRLAITYNISEDKIRTRVFWILEKCGAWKQYSVFELEISRVQRVQLEDEIGAVCLVGTGCRPCRRNAPENPTGIALNFRDSPHPTGTASSG